MTKLIALMVMVLMTYNGISQRLANDSVTCIPNSQLRAAVKQIELGKAAIAELAITRQNMAIQAVQISLRDSIIRAGESVRNDYQALRITFDQQMANMQRQNQLNVDWVNDLNRKLKRQKRKTVFTAIGGIIATGAAIYFLK